MRRLLFLTVIICSACTESNNPLKKATIYYNPNQTPWGILKVVDTPGRVFLKDSLKLNKLTITNFDSLKFIYDQIEHATRDSISFDYQEVDTLSLIHICSARFFVSGICKIKKAE